MSAMDTFSRDGCSDWRVDDSAVERSRASLRSRCSCNFWSVVGSSEECEVGEVEGSMERRKSFV